MPSRETIQQPPLLLGKVQSSVSHGTSLLTLALSSALLLNLIVLYILATGVSSYSMLSSCGIFPLPELPFTLFFS